MGEVAEAPVAGDDPRLQSEVDEIRQRVAGHGADPDSQVVFLEGATQTERVTGSIMFPLKARWKSWTRTGGHGKAGENAGYPDKAAEKAMNTALNQQGRQWLLNEIRNAPLLRRTKVLSGCFARGWRQTAPGDPALRAPPSRSLSPAPGTWRGFTSVPFNKYAQKAEINFSLPLGRPFAQVQNCPEATCQFGRKRCNSCMGRGGWLEIHTVNAPNGQTVRQQPYRLSRSWGRRES